MIFKRIITSSKKSFEHFLSIKKNHYATNVSTNFTPVQIKVPWGKIEGKLWGPTDKQPILALHGFMDNAGSFDHIAPLLENCSVLAIDLPGHGFSSWLEQGIYYDEKVFSQAVRLIVKHYGWQKVKLLGHSYGGMICFNYARLFPDETEFVINIESIGFIPKTVVESTVFLANAIDKFIELEKKIISDPPSYTKDEIVKKWSDSAISVMDKKSIETLLTRGSKMKDDGTYYFTRDYFLTVTGFHTYYSEDVIKEMAETINCPFLVIRAMKSFAKKYETYWSNVGNIMKKNCADFQMVRLDEDHHVHMTNPSLVSNEINPFLKKYNK